MGVFQQGHSESFHFYLSLINEDKMIHCIILFLLKNAHIYMSLNVQ